MPRSRNTSSRGTSQRPLKAGEQIRHALVNILSRNEIHDPELARFSITVTEVRMSPDLRHATAFVTPLGGGDCKPLLAELKRCKVPLRMEVARVVKMRYAPELHFQPDESFDYAEGIEKILHDPVVSADLKRAGTEADTESDTESGDDTSATDEA